MSLHHVCAMSAGAERLHWILLDLGLQLGAAMSVWEANVGPLQDQ